MGLKRQEIYNLKATLVNDHLRVWSLSTGNRRSPSLRKDELKVLNIYRVISLSLVMSMFITAPLLCVHPISSQLKKEQKLAVKNNQLEKVTNVLKNRNKKPSLEAKTAVRTRDPFTDRVITGLGMNMNCRLRRYSRIRPLLFLSRRKPTIGMTINGRSEIRLKQLLGLEM